MKRQLSRIETCFQNVAKMHFVQTELDQFITVPQFTMKLSLQKRRLHPITPIKTTSYFIDRTFVQTNLKV